MCRPQALPLSTKRNIEELQAQRTLSKVRINFQPFPYNPIKEISLEEILLSNIYFLLQKLKPKLNRLIVPSAKINLNVYWNAFENFMVEPSSSSPSSMHV